MVTFKSIIAFDAETTSLPEVDHNTTKIIELAFLGCEVEHLKNSDGLPRVLHKLVLLFNPKKLIHPDATKVSGLNNELLMNVKPFREVDVEVLRQFISRLPEPVCIIAHNGDNFDFPILRRALKKVNKELQNNVYCVDSIKGFQSLLKESKHNQQSLQMGLLQKRASNETTPPHKKTQPVNNLQYKHVSQQSLQMGPLQKRASNETTPPHKKTQPVNNLQYKHVSRELFPDETALSTWVQENVLMNAPSSSHLPISFKLKDIYYFYFKGYFLNSHRAEDDSKALLSCIMRCEGFLDWMNENAVVFNSVQPLF